MELKSLENYSSSRPLDDDARKRKMEERVSRLKQISDSSISESQEILNLADSGMITEDDMMKYDPDMSGMVQYNSNNVATGSNVQITNQVPYSQQMQNGYNYAPQYANVDTYMYQQQASPIMYQNPYIGYYSNNQINTNTINMSQGYYGENTSYYQPQMRQYNTEGLSYDNPYGLDPRYFDSDEEMSKEYNRLEEERKKKCEGQVSLLMYFRDFAEEAGAEFTEDRETFYKKIKGEYGYKTIAQIKLEKEESIKKQKELSIENGYSRYNSKGYREYKSKMVVSITTRDGKEKIMTKPVDPETGYRTTIYTRRDDEVLAFNRQHFWDIYNKEINWYANFAYAMNNRVKEFKSKYPDNLSWEQLVGPEAKMADYYDDIVTKQDSAKIKVSLMKGRWSNGTSYTNNFLHSGMSTDITFDNMSGAFRTDYELAKQIHMANLSKTPDEIEISSVLNNSLHRDYDQKRAIFINKMLSGNARTNMAAGATQREVIASPDINAITNSEATVYLNQLEEQERENKKLSLQKSMDPFSKEHVLSEVNVPNPGCIPGTNIPIINRKIITGVEDE